MTGGFTGAGGIPAIDRPMLVAAPGVKIPKKKDKKALVRQEALRLVSRLLDYAGDQKVT